MAKSQHRMCAIGLVAAGVAACAMTGCTTVRIYNAEVEQTRHFGFVIVSVAPIPSSASVVVTRGLGLTIGAHAGTLGFLSETAFIAPDASGCRSLIVVEDLVELQRLGELLDRQPHLARLCIATPRGVSQ